MRKRPAVWALSAMFVFIANGLTALAQEPPCHSGSGPSWRSVTPCLEGKVRDTLETPLAPGLFQMGQGFFVSGGSFVLTAAHVVSGCRYFSLMTRDGVELRSGLVLWDSRRDIAILRPEYEGQPSFAKPAGMSLATLDLTRPVGRVRVPSLDLLAAFQPGQATPTAIMSRAGSAPHDGPLGPQGAIVLEGELMIEGDSGAPLLNDAGFVVGMVTANAPLRNAAGQVAQMTVASPADQLSEALRLVDDQPAPPPPQQKGRNRTVLPAPVADAENFRNLVRVRCR